MISKAIEATKTLVAVGAATLLVAGVLPAWAEVDSQCQGDWHTALVTQQVGQKCGYLDAATADKLKKAQDARVQCAQAKASPEEKNWLATSMAEGQSKVAARVAGIQCTPEARKNYDSNVSKLTGTSANAK
jgi:hypothetical protein